MDFKRIKKELLDFTRQEVDNFLKEHNELRFYAFAYDCNIEYGEVCLCFNTETAFENQLEAYRKGSHGSEYQNEEKVYQLRYNTGDWQFQCFASTEILNEEELEELEESEEEDLRDELMDLVCKALIEFSETTLYDQIPKDIGFKILCLDHDDEVHDAEVRLNRVRDRMKLN